MKYWFSEIVILLTVSLLGNGCCCFHCASPWPHVVGEPSCGAGPPCFEPNCGITACEPDCAIAACEPDCAITACEPDCGIVACEPDCGIVACEPDCGCAGPPHPCGCGWGWGCWGRHGLFTGWGPDYEAAAAGWKFCPGPCEWVKSLLCCGGCGGCYWDEWACDPPRCCDPCGLMCGNYGCQGGCGFGAACGGAPCGSGVCNNGRTVNGYVKDFHRWPPNKPARRSAAPPTPSRLVNRSPAHLNCDCEQCRHERSMMAQRRNTSRVQQASHQQR